MKYLDEYRDPELARVLLAELDRVATRPWTLMEVCGGQTHTIVRQGIDELLPAGIRMIHGPGCPVCVTPLETLDRAMAIAARPDVMFTSFGDMLRVPGSRTDLLALKARGADVRVVYSPMDAVTLAQTPPGAAGGLPRRRASRPPRRPTRWRSCGRRRYGLTNFSILVSHVLVPPAMTAILEAAGCEVQGFLAAGHVCTVMGWTEYEPLAATYRVPIVVTGFEPLDLIEGILMAVRQLEEGRFEVENQYARAVRRTGNAPAQEALRRVFRVSDRAWRGIGTDPVERARTGRGVFRLRRGTPLRRRPPVPGGAPRLRRRSDPHRREAADRLRRVRHDMHPTVPARRADGVQRGHLRRLLHRRPAAIRRHGAGDRRWSRPMTTLDPLAASCPVPLTEAERVLLGHGSGGQLSASLIGDVLVPALGSAAPAGALEDAAIVGVDGVDLAVSTDSYVVSPLFFPGGDIGALAVHGTVNDLAMRAAMPVALAVAYVIEEGFPLADLRRVAASVGDAARAAGVPVVTGDTKVVGRGAADGLFVTTTGIGRRIPGASPSATGAAPGDAVLLSGAIGRHGTAVLSTREGLGFEADISSDTRPLHRLVAAMVRAGGMDVHALRDPTRGGIASALNEIAAASQVGIEIDEHALPVPEPVRAACEILGLDPVHVANEGCLVAFVAPQRADAVLAAMRAEAEGAGAVRIGSVQAADHGRVVVRTAVGSRRILDMLVGEQLPRIC